MNLAQSYRRTAEPRLEPPEPQPNPEITNPDYEHASPQERRAVAEGTMTALDEVLAGLEWLKRTDTQDWEPFIETIGPDNRKFSSYPALERVKKLVKEYLDDEILPWCEGEELEKSDA